MHFLVVKIAPAVGFFMGFALVCGLVLAVVARFFHTDQDPRAEAINGILPQANCGACGYAGCRDYAEAIASDPAIALSLCRVGGKKSAAEIARLMGRSL
jgi:electron transport complex protein RnfB